MEGEKKGEFVLRSDGLDSEIIRRERKCASSPLTPEFLQVSPSAPGDPLIGT